MAAVIYGADRVLSKNRDMRVYSGRIKGPNASVVVVDGHGFTVTQGGGTGIYAIVLDKAPQKLFGADAIVVSATANLNVQVASISADLKTITFTVYTGSTGSATDLGATDQILFNICIGWSQRS
jgi:hypothetical protein